MRLLPRSVQTGLTGFTGLRGRDVEKDELCLAESNGPDGVWLLERCMNDKTDILEMRWLSRYDKKCRPALIALVCDKDYRKFMQLSYEISSSVPAIAYFRAWCTYHGWGVERNRSNGLSAINGLVAWAKENQGRIPDASWILGAANCDGFAHDLSAEESRNALKNAYDMGSVFGARRLLRILPLLQTHQDRVMQLQVAEFCHREGYPGAKEDVSSALGALLLDRELSESDWQNFHDRYVESSVDKAEALFRVGMSIQRQYAVKSETDAFFGKMMLILKEAWDAGSMDAAVEIGEAYIGTSWSNAKFWYKKALGRGNDKGVMRMTTKLFSLRHKWPDDEKRRQFVIRVDEVADSGIDSATRGKLYVKIGCHMLNLLGLDRRKAEVVESSCPAFLEAKFWFERAMSVEYVPAFVTFGDFYRDVGKIDLAGNLYGEAAKCGGHPNYCSLGDVCARKGNVQDALTYYQLAASTDGPDSYLCIARMYRRRKEVERAKEWYLRARENGSLESFWAIGHLMMRGEVFAKDPRRAFDFFLTAANKGHARSMMDVATCYQGRHKVEGSPLDVCAAFMWCEKAAMAHWPGAWLHLGEMYRDGVGCQRDEQKAVNCFMYAARLDVPLAYHEVGLCYEHGMGVRQNLNEAIRSFWRGWGFRCKRCEEALHRLCAESVSRRNYLFLKKIANGECDEMPLFLTKDPSLHNGKNDDFVMRRIDEDIMWGESDGEPTCCYVDDVPVPEAGSQEETNMIYWNTH